MLLAVLRSSSAMISKHRSVEHFHTRLSRTRGQLRFRRHPLAAAIAALLRLLCIHLGLISLIRRTFVLPTLPSSCLRVELLRLLFSFERLLDLRLLSPLLPPSFRRDEGFGLDFRRLRSTLPLPSSSLSGVSASLLPPLPSSPHQARHIQAWALLVRGSPAQGRSAQARRATELHSI